MGWRMDWKCRVGQMIWVVRFDFMSFLIYLIPRFSAEDNRADECWWNHGIDKVEDSGRPWSLCPRGFH